VVTHRCSGPRAAAGTTAPGGTLSSPRLAVLGASALTAAGLRLLPLLATHLSFPEIAAELYLSRNTVKSHTHSIYRKLGTSSRSQAVTRLRDLRLLEA
jgi:LuxR family transcriptional regulator, maltose regulon positive regulatory protein